MGDGEYELSLVSNQLEELRVWKREKLPFYQRQKKVGPERRNCVQKAGGWTPNTLSGISPMPVAPSGERSSGLFPPVNVEKKNGSG